uniref:Uncharacterized protein n=1 Tax=Arundo donax TaxID=35708 RepID=A0A0A9G2C9_ARUDO
MPLLAGFPIPQSPQARTQNPDPRKAITPSRWEKEQLNCFSQELNPPRCMPPSKLKNLRNPELRRWNRGEEILGAASGVSKKTGAVGPPR